MIEDKIIYCADGDINRYILQMSQLGAEVWILDRFDSRHFRVRISTPFEDIFYTPVRKVEKSDFIPIKGNVKKVSI